MEIGEEFLSPHPLCPPSPLRKGGLVIFREALPLFNSPLVFVAFKGGRKNIKMGISLS